MVEPLEHVFISHKFVFLFYYYFLLMWFINCSFNSLVFCSLLALVILSTIIQLYNSTTTYDHMSEHSESNNWFRIIECFSLIKNVKSLLAESNAKYSALDTIRLLLILNAHLVHAYLLTYTLGVGTLKKVITYALPRFFNYSRYILVKSPLMIDALFTLRWKSWSGISDRILIYPLKSITLAIPGV